MERWFEERRCFDTEGKNQNLLILSRMGKTLSKMVVRIFDKYRELAGIEKEAALKDLKCGMKTLYEEIAGEEVQLRSDLA